MSTESAKLNNEYVKTENSATLLTEKDFDKICRTCLKQKQLIPISHQLSDTGQNFSTILQSCASIVVT